jgi:multidrug resistance efflux pump
MIIAIAITVLYVIFVWLIFFKFKLLKFNIAWGIVSFWVGFHLILIFVISLRFFQPYTLDAHIVHRTIQIIPRLPEPTLLTEVLVKENEPVKKGDPLFRFDQTIYRARVKNAQAQLAQAKQNVLVLEADVEAAAAQVEAAKANVSYAETQFARYSNLSRQGAARQEETDRWHDEVETRTSQLLEAHANLKKAQLTYDSQIDGVNTAVAEAEAQLVQENYYLDNTTIYAPTDGFIINLQPVPGLVVGILRVGAIASFVTNDDPYLLASYRQAHLKFVEEGQPVEIALDIYPGQIFTGRVEDIWWATGQGQYMPSGRIPDFLFPKFPGRFAVRISFDDEGKIDLPAGAHGAAAIFTGRGKGYEPLRRIGIRIYSWANWVIPLDFI